jgi:VIT1/CCC1 family predicted Fe2+/Mn2+ transporter
LSAALEERERLSRQVHDGVIQVLARVARRGHEIDGATSELAELASEQERALRRWLSSVDIDRDGDTQAIDLRTLLRGLALTAAATAKLFLFDLATLDGISRVATIIVVGLVLLGMGAGYARCLAQQCPR